MKMEIWLVVGMVVMLAVAVVTMVVAGGCAMVQTSERGDVDVEQAAVVIRSGMELATHESLAAIEHEGTRLEVKDYLSRVSSAGMSAFSSDTSTPELAKERFAVLLEQDEEFRRLSIPGMLGWFIDQAMQEFPVLERWGPASKLAVAIVEAVYDPAIAYPESMQMLAYAFFQGIHEGLD